MIDDTDLIRRGDAVKICEKHSYSNNQYVSMRMIDAAREIRDLPAALDVQPAPDVAQISADALREAIEKLERLVPHPAGGPFSHANTARVMALDTVKAVRALITTPPPPDAMAERVAALVEAADAMLDAFVIHEDDAQTAAYEATCAALAAIKGGKQMREIVELEARIARIKAIEEKAKIQCALCDGKGSFLDTTYDRCGNETVCSKCFGTGLPADRVQQIIRDAFAPYLRKGGGA